MPMHGSIPGAVAVLFALTLSAAVAEAQVPTSDAQDFVGAWDVAIQGDQPVTIVLAIRDQEGNLAATANTMGMESRVTSIQRRESALVLTYTVDYQGQAVGVSITLTPGEQGMRASLSAADGMYTATGTATRR